MGPITVTAALCSGSDGVENGAVVGEKRFLVDSESGFSVESILLTSILADDLASDLISGVCNGIPAELLGVGHGVRLLQVHHHRCCWLVARDGACDVLDRWEG